MPYEWPPLVPGDPDEIARYVAVNEDRLSGLSKSEALKNKGKRRRG